MVKIALAVRVAFEEELGLESVFGAIEGILEAVVGTVCYYIFNEDLSDSAVEFGKAQGLTKNKTAAINMKDLEMHVAVAHVIQNVKVHTQ